MSHAITKRLQICADINIECMVRGDPAHKSRGGERESWKNFRRKKKQVGTLISDTRVYTYTYTYIHNIMQ